MVALDPNRYRMDTRTVEQFAKDIRHGTKVEKDIIEKYLAYYEAKYGEKLIMENNGCGNSGQLLSYKHVNTSADFKLNGKPVEIKFNNMPLSVFRFKADQLESYLKQGASVIWVNGYESENPLFTVLKTKDPEYVKREKIPLHFLPWGGKLCYELYANEFYWTSLREAEKDGEGLRLQKNNERYSKGA